MPTSMHTDVIVPFGRVEFARERRRALTLEDLPQVVPGAADALKGMSDPVESSHQMCDILRRLCQLQGSHEHLFLLLYFDRVIHKLKSGATLRDILLPLPKTRFAFASDTNVVQADFAFWTGRNFVVVYVQEARIYQDRSVEERRLKLFGFDVFRLMADEFETRGLFGQTGLNILEAVGLRRRSCSGGL
jgi:hypothetical protein